MIVILRRGEAPSRNQAVTAWPLSWQATFFFSISERTVDCSNPAMTRSEADSKSEGSTNFFSFRTARMAASLQRFAKSAPLNPKVNVAILFEYSQSVFQGESFILLRQIQRIYFRPLRSGNQIQTIRSNLPGLVNALSSIYFLLVAAKTMMSSKVPNPSISTSNWFKVLALSSLAPPNLSSLFLPIASISSMKMMAGVCFLALANNSLTLRAPIPAKSSTNQLPLTEKNGTLASPAHALASIVFPVPGGPASRAPLGTFAPIFLYFSGLFKKSTNSLTQILALPRPAMSLKSTLGLETVSACPRTFVLKIIPNLELKRRIGNSKGKNIFTRVFVNLLIFSSKGSSISIISFVFNVLLDCIDSMQLSICSRFVVLQ